MAKAATAVKEKSVKAAETAGEKAVPSSGTDIIVLKKEALSVDVGPRVINAMFKDASRELDLRDAKRETDAALREIDKSRDEKSYAALQQLTLAIVKAAKADSRIDLTRAFVEDRKAIEHLHNQIGIALGFKENAPVQEARSGVGYTSPVVYSLKVKDCFPMTGEDKESALYRRKETFRSNFLTQLKKCEQAAFALIDSKMQYAVDKAGTLQLSGPAVKQHFGMEKVLVNEKQTVKGPQGKDTKLTQKPSFAALARLGASAVSGGGDAATDTAGKNNRTVKPSAIPTAVVDAAKATSEAKKEGTPDAHKKLMDAIMSLCRSLRTSLEGVTTDLREDVVKELEAVANAIDAKLPHD